VRVTEEHSVDFVCACVWVCVRSGLTLLVCLGVVVVIVVIVVIIVMRVALKVLIRTIQRLSKQNKAEVKQNTARHKETNE